MNDPDFDGSGSPEYPEMSFKTFEDFVKAQPEWLQGITRELREFTLKLHKMEVKYILSFSPESDAVGVISNLRSDDKQLAGAMIDDVLKTLAKQDCMPPNIHQAEDE